jgi:hypothetical protein
MLTLSTIRAGVVFIALAMISALISANIRQWASAEGHDRYIVKFAEWASTRQKWLWLFLALSGAIFAWSLQPETIQDQNIQKEVSSPAQPTTPVPDNKPERPPPAYGGLYPWQITIFMNGLAEMKEDFAVPDVDAPSPSALKMQTLIKQLGYEGRFVPLLDTSSKQAAPLRANEVGNFAIFIGPSPL